MERLVEKAVKKLNDYGIEIFEQYKSKPDAHVIIAEHMVIIVHPKNIVLSFEATTKPETSANFALIMKEISGVDLFISDSFVFTNKNQLVCGEKAHELVNKTLKQNVLNEEAQSRYYERILENTEGFEC